MGFPCGSADKESACNAGDLGSIPRLGRSSEKGKATLQYSGLENSMDCIVHGIAKNQKQLSDFHSLVNEVFFLYTFFLVTEKHRIVTAKCSHHAIIIILLLQ